MGSGNFYQGFLLAFAATNIFLLIGASGLLFLRKDKRADRIRMLTMQIDEFDRLQRQRSSEWRHRLQQWIQSRIKGMRGLLEQFRLQRLTASKNLKFKLAAAGLRHQSAPVIYVFSRVLFAVAGMLLVLLILGLSSKFNPSPSLQTLIILAGGIVGYFVPAIGVKNATQKRQQSMLKSFPDMVDMLVICVESGLSIGAAFTRVTEEIAESSPVLSRELALLSAELMFLGDRRISYQNFSDRTGLQASRSLATTLIQSDRYGTPVGTALKTLAQEYRDERMSQAEKRAAALPAKLSVPMVLFFMPSLFLVILGPGLITIFSK